MSEALKHKKDMILDAARDLGVEKWTVAEIDQLRRKLLVNLRNCPLLHAQVARRVQNHVLLVFERVGHRLPLRVGLAACV